MSANIKNYTEAEKDALEEKLFFPQKKVLCPRCGNEISYKELGNSSVVKCNKTDCISGSIRGL